MTLALEGDINKIAGAGCSPRTGWRARLANKSTPYTSTIVFLVRKGNPKRSATGAISSRKASR